ncbi:5-formyltetrahydrofolate cyclo-ligase [Luteimonas abyssi]|uniref:5-formyltetrahydrofolate cyclo-ligase n=1 Tax=Luteimonas abyssi TaxID=1247514 RepID=UPI000737D7A2|nr:5-formyltetrahydrofolate cyclo-ligase [Luteimonas abyssi]
MTADRRRLRGTLRAGRRDLPAATRLRAAETVAERLLALPFLPDRGYAAGYWAFDGELALHVWQMRLPPGLVYCLPVLHEDGRLRFAPWRPGDALVTNRHGIPEPDVAPGGLLDAQALSLAIVPLVGFDRRGHRLGMGAGWYDRTFAFRSASPAPPWLVGAAHATQEVERLDVAPWDVPLDAICTERETLIPDPA